MELETSTGVCNGHWLSFLPASRPHIWSIALQLCHVDVNAWNYSHIGLASMYIHEFPAGPSKICQYSTRVNPLGRLTRGSWDV